MSTPRVAPSLGQAGAGESRRPVQRALLLFWGGLVSGMYTVGLTHLGSRLKGADLVAATAAFIFCYAIGTIAGPQAVGISMDVAGTDGFAWSLAVFFGLYVVLYAVRFVFRAKQA